VDELWIGLAVAIVVGVLGVVGFFVWAMLAQTT
jgi:hypothetical protein